MMRLSAAARHAAEAPPLPSMAPAVSSTSSSDLDLLKAACIWG